jgi:hypothetical protein
MDRLLRIGFPSLQTSPKPRCRSHIQHGSDWGTFNASLIGCLFYWPPGILLSTRENHAAGMVKQGNKVHCRVAWTIGCHAWSSFRWYRWWMSPFLWQAFFTLLHPENTKILWLKLLASWPCREFMTCCQMNDYCQPPFSACCFSLWLWAKLS